APVLVGYLPLLFGGLLAVGEPAQLLVGVDVQPELEHYRAPFGQTALELIDLGIRAQPLVGPRKSLYALDHDASIPRPVEYSYMAILGQRPPEPPQILVVQFHRRRRRRGHDLESARIQRARQPLYRAALAGRVPALEAQH